MRIQEYKGLNLYQKVAESNKEKFKSKDVSMVKTRDQKDVRIKQEILEMERWEKHVEKHEQNHGVVGGGHVSAASYVYTYGPDGRKYIQGGAVSVKLPGGLSQESLDTLERLKNATSASPDTSQQDLISGAIISAEHRSREMLSRLKHATEKYEAHLQNKAIENLEQGREIFAYKKLELRSTRLLELFV